MKLGLSITAVTVGFFSLITGTGYAQDRNVPSSQFSRPTVSPYLNLNRFGTSTGLNYYNLVRPQLDYNSSIVQLRQQVGVNREGIAGLEQTTSQPQIRATGFVPQFMSFSPYFMTYSGTGRSGAVANQLPSPQLRGR